MEEEGLEREIDEYDGSYLFTSIDNSWNQPRFIYLLLRTFLALFLTKLSTA